MPVPKVKVSVAVVFTFKCNAAPAFNSLESVKSSVALPVNVVNEETTVSLLLIVAAVAPVAAIVNVPAAPNGLLIVAIIFYLFLLVCFLFDCLLFL